MAAEIRSAESTDLPAVQRVARAAWHAAHEPIIGEESVEEFLAEYYSRAALERRLDGETVLPVAVDDRVVGFTVAGPADGPTTYVLGRIYVRPDRWGEEIGQRLPQEIQRRARERGGERMRLGVIAENDRAVCLYEAAGYERVDERIGTTTYEYQRSLWLSNHDRSVRRTERLLPGPALLSDDGDTRRRCRPDGALGGSTDPGGARRGPVLSRP